MRLEKPHSLSYQDTTRQNVPSTTCVPLRSKIELKRVVVEIGRNQRLRIHTQDAPERAVGRLDHRLVDLLDGGGPRRLEGQVDQAHIRHRHPDRGAVELALQLRQHEADRLGGAGRAGDQIYGAGPRPVGVLVQGIHRALVAGIGVHRRHIAVLDADRLVQHLRHRGEAIGGAGGIGDDVVLLGELVVVDAEHHGEVGAGARRGDQHALGAGGQVLRRALAVGEAAGAFHDDIDAEVAPGKLFRRCLRQDGDVLAVGLEMPVGDVDPAAEPPMHAVELEQMGVHLGRAEIVDGDEVEILAPGFEERSEGEPADPAKSVNGDALVRHPLLTSSSCRSDHAPRPRRPRR